MEKPLSDLSNPKTKTAINNYGCKTEQDSLFWLGKGQEFLRKISTDHSFPPSFTLDNLCEKETDKFKNEVRISTFRSRLIAFPHKHPIDLLYISKLDGERFYVLYTGRSHISSTGSLIFNINGNTNIVLRIDNNDCFLDGKTTDDLEFWERKNGDYYKSVEYRSYLPISKDDYLKCCLAEHLSVRVNSDNAVIAYEADCDGLIPCFQMLYDKTSDEHLFENNKEKWMQSFEKSAKEKLAELVTKKEQERAAESKGFSEMLIYILIVVVGIAAIFIFS